MSRRIILVTGMPRSGTTAVGRALSFAPGAGTIHEPLNSHAGIRSVRYYFEVLGADGFNEGDLDEIVEGIRTLNLRFKPGLFPEERALRRAIKRIIGGRPANTYRLCCMTPRLRTLIWKDPFAVFLLDALVARYEFPIVVPVRNPWAIAASFKRLGWRGDLRDLYRRLREAGHLSAEEELPPSCDGSDSIAGAAMLWRLVHRAILNVNDSSGRVRLVDLDAVVAAPTESYRSLFADLGLAWTPRVARRINKMYDRRGSAPTIPQGRPHDQRRDLSAVNQYWQQTLTEKEIADVEEIVAPLWHRVVDAVADADPANNDREAPRRGVASE